MSAEELLEDMMMNLDVDKDKAKKILEYFEKYWTDELIYHNKARLGSLGYLKVKSSPEKKDLAISFAAFNSFLGLFRKKYRIVHMIEVEENGKDNG